MILTNLVRSPGLPTDFEDRFNDTVLRCHTTLRQFDNSALRLVH
jgi:hypothetical protein